MTDYKISELNTSSTPQPTDLTVVVRTGTSTKKLELSGLWEACLDGSLNTNNTAVFKQDVTVQGNVILGDNSFDRTTINGILSAKNNTVIDNNLTVKGNTVLGDACTDSTEIKGNLKVSCLSAGITNSVLIESAEVVQKRNINSSVWNTTVTLMTSVSGVLAIANGGTGQTTANNAFNALVPSQSSHNKKVLKTDGTNTFWGNPDNWIYKNSNYTAIEGDKILADTSVSPFTISLPPTPQIGTVISLVDAKRTWDTFNLIVNRNTNTIENSASDLICDDSQNEIITLIYNGSTWRVYI
jgi:hypothetical protein